MRAFLVDFVYDVEEFWVAIFIFLAVFACVVYGSFYDGYSVWPYVESVLDAFLGWPDAYFCESSFVDAWLADCVEFVCEVF